MNSRLLDYCDIIGSKVTEYAGVKEYVATGDVEYDKIVSSTSVTYDNKPSRANRIGSIDDLLFAAMKGTKKVLLINNENKDYIYSTGFVFLKCKDNMLPSYLYWYLKSDYFNNQKDKYSTGATMQAISKNDIKKINISVVPSINEQIKRVDNLLKINSAISTCKKQIDDLNKYKASLYNEMFVNCVNHKKMGDLCDIKARIGWQGLTKSEYLSTGDYLLVTGIDFKENQIDFDNCAYVTKDRYDQDIHIQLKKDDVLVTKDGTIGKVAYVDELPKPATLNSGVFVVRSKTNEIKNKYIEYALLSDDFTRFIDSIKTGATISHLNQYAFINYEIPVPDLKLQEKFISIVYKVDNHINELKMDLKDLNDLMQGKMNEYFGDANG